MGHREAGEGAGVFEGGDDNPGGQYPHQMILSTLPLHLLFFIFIRQLTFLFQLSLQRGGDN